MEWFKHDTGASTDAKMRKLIMRHGAVGYAVYFHCLELIMADVNKNNITFQLEHDSEIIADNLKINGNGTESGIDIVEKIMYTLIDLKLFESISNKITCFKLLTRLDSSMTSNSAFRDKIKETKSNKIMIPSCSSHDTVMQEEKRIEQKRTEENKIDYNEHFESVWKLYPLKKGKGRISLTKKKTFVKYSIEEWTTIIERYNSTVSDKNYLMHGSTFFNGGYIDYIDEEYEADPIHQPKEYEAEPRTQEERYYFDELRKKDVHSDLWNEEMEKRLSSYKLRAEQSLSTQEVF